MEQDNVGTNVKYFSANSTKRYIDVLDGLVNRYNKPDMAPQR